MTEQEVSYLDLDALAPKADFVIKLNGTEHAMKEMTVDDFIWATKIAEEKGDDINPDNMATMFDAMLDVLTRQFPTVKREELSALGFHKLTALLKFTRELGEEGSDGLLKRAAEEGKVELVPTPEVEIAQDH